VTNEVVSINEAIEAQILPPSMGNIERIDLERSRNNQLLTNRAF
jgi:hypothetical protein